MNKSILIPTILLIAASIQPIHAAIIAIENQEDFNKIMQSDSPSVILFSAEWCSPCTAIKEALKKIVDDPEFAHITFANVDYDKNPTIIEQQKINATPTLRFVQANVQKNEIIGLPKSPEETIAAEIKKAFGTTAHPITTAQPMEEKKSEEMPAHTQEPSHESTGIVQGFFKAILCILNLIKDGIMQLIDMIKNLFSAR